MINVSTCEVSNEIDKENVRLYVKWFDSHFMIMLLNSKMELLIGEMTAEDIKYYSDELSKSSDDYLKDIKNAFSSRDGKIQFFLHNNTFTWKRRMWTLGKIKLQQISEMKALARIFGELLAHHEGIQEKLIQIGAENESLKQCNQKLSASIEEMIKVKNAMEKEFYKKFLFILNCKKEKIRELESILESNKKEEKSVFEERTDESDISDNDDKQWAMNDQVKPEKRKLECDVRQSKMNKVKRATLSTSTSSIVKSDSSPIASTSKDSPDENAHPTVLSSGSSDYELELDDSNDADTANKSVRRLSFTEELEEDLFAQS